jgi:hypothetical protein
MMGKTIWSTKTLENLDLNQFLMNLNKLRLKRTREIKSPSQTTRQRVTEVGLRLRLMEEMRDKSHKVIEKAS